MRNKSRKRRVEASFSMGSSQVTVRQSRSLYVVTSTNLRVIERVKEEVNGEIGTLHEKQSSSRVHTEFNKQLEQINIHFESI